VEVVGTPPGIFARMVTRAELAFNGLLIDPRSLCIFEAATSSQSENNSYRLRISANG